MGKTLQSMPNAKPFPLYRQDWIDPSPRPIYSIHCDEASFADRSAKEHILKIGRTHMTSARPVVVKQLPERLSVEQGRIFFHEVEPCLQAERPRVVLDCSRVRQLDSAGIQVLLHCLEEAMKRNGDVKLAAIPPGAAKILELTRVDSLFEAFDNISEAVNSFYQFPLHAFQQAVQPGYDAAVSESAA
jgi:anti-sigma B factor antagonist